MRIFLSCLQSPSKHTIPAYQFWENYFKRGLEESGHEWIEAQEVDWAEGLIYCDEKDLSYWRDRTWNLTLDFIKRQHRMKTIDLFLSYLFPKQVEPSVIKDIQSLGIPCVNFFCDNVREFTRIPKSFYCFNLHWVPEFKALKMYQQEGLKYVYAPMPVWIPLDQRHSDHPEHYGLSFIGSRDIQREVLLAQAIQSHIPIEIRGAGWIDNSSKSLININKSRSLWQTSINQWNFINSQGIPAWLRKIQSKSLPRVNDSIFASYVRQQPSHQEYNAIIQQSAITLGINRYPSYRYPFTRPNTYSRMRDIEAPMMGACYLTEWTEGLDDLYELGEEIETYRSSEELVEKIQHLISSSALRNSLRLKGQKRALSEHSITKSIDKIWQAIN